MLRIVVAYLATAVVFLVADGLWLTLVAGRIYRPRLGDMLAETISWPPAVLFYLLYVAGLLIFAVLPALAGGPNLESGRWPAAFVTGALFGFFCYATYDLTNQATLRTWSTTVTIVDIAWGSFVSGLAAALGTLFAGAILAALGRG